MKAGYVVGAIAAVFVIAFGIFFFDFDVTEEARLPDVDVNVEGGNLPEIEVQSGEIEVGTEQMTVTVPTVDIQSAEEANNDS